MSLNLKNLITKPESETLDFKREWHSNKKDLIKDIICMANVLTEDSRYILVGFCEKTKKFCSTTEDPNRRTLDQIVTLLRSAKLNFIPDVKLHTIIEDSNEIDVIEIVNSSKKPYFLTQDYTHPSNDHKNKLRAGAVYSRNGDSNTPSDKTSEDYQIENMYWERFGLSKSPLERFKIYLKDTDGWVKDYGLEEELYFYYNKFPEFRISPNTNAEREHYEGEPWSINFPDRNPSAQHFYLYYHTTVLSHIRVIWLDGARSLRVQPYGFFYEDPKHKWVKSMYYLENDFLYLTNQMLLEKCGVDKYQERECLFFPVFKTKDNAEVVLKKGWKNQCEDYNYFYYDPSQEAFVMSRGSKVIPISGLD